MTLATPAWLLGLLLVPAIWYLHRSGPILRRHPVASLDLWQDDRARAAQAGERRPPDSAWLRRAAILTLLCIALAGPQWQRPAARVTLWVDDSLSMQTVEDGETRLGRGLRLAQAALRETAVHDVIVRPLSDPARAYPSVNAVTMQAIESRAGTREPQLPAPDALAPARAHWLVTDGADEGINAWLGNTAVERVIQVASSSRNVGITRVTLRPQPADPQSGAIQILLRNGGSEPEDTDCRSIGRLGRAGLANGLNRCRRERDTESGRLAAAATPDRAAGSGRRVATGRQRHRRWNLAGFDRLAHRPVMPGRGDTSCRRASRAADHDWP